MQQTVPTPVRTALDADRYHTRRGLISPLARAALDNGVSFEDVQAYVEAAAPATEGSARKACELAWYEACNLPENDCTTPALAAHVTAMVTDTALEGALLRSVVSSGSVEHARLWWRGVL